MKIPGLDSPVDAASVIWLEADGNYSRIHFSGGKQYLACQTLKWFESHLDYFIRTHKSNLVNPRYILSFDTARRRQAGIVLIDGTKLAISRRRVELTTDKFSATI